MCLELVLVKKKTTVVCYIVHDRRIKFKTGSGAKIYLKKNIIFLSEKLL